MPVPMLAGKTCTRCGESKPLTAFRKKLDKTTSACADCLSAADKKYWADHTPEKRAEVRAKKREYHAANPDIKKNANARFLQNSMEKHKASQKKYYLKNQEYFYAKSKQWALENPEKARLFASKAEAKMRRENPLFRLKKNMRGLISGSLRNKGMRKHLRTLEILGCSWAELMRHIEMQFVDGMSWENRNAWHVDHRIPLSSGKTEEELVKLNHFTNLQPLWALDNRRKGAKLDWALDGNAQKDTGSR